MSANSRIVRNTLYLYLRMFVLLIIGLYTSRAIFNALGDADYGLNNVVTGFITLFTFLHATMTGATTRYITFFLGKGNAERLRDVFSIATKIHTLIAIVVVLLAETVGLWYVCTKMVIPDGRMTAALVLYQLSIATTFLLIVSYPYDAAIIAAEKMGAFAYISLFDAAMRLLMAIALPFVSCDRLIFLGIWLFLLQVADRIIYVVYCRRKLPFARYRKTNDRRLFREMFAFAGWNTIGTATIPLYAQGINLVLNYFCGLTVNAARAIAVQVEGYVSMFVRNVQTAINPQITKSYASSDHERMYTLAYTSSKYSFFILWIIALPLMIEAPYVLELWLGRYPDHTVSFLRIILIISLFDATTTSIVTMALAHGDIRNYQIITGGTLLLGFPLTIVALKLTGIPESVFWTQLIVFLIAIGVRLVMLRRMVSINIKDYLLSVYGRTFPVAALSPLLPILVHNSVNPSFPCLMLTCTASIISVLSLVYAIGMTPTERTFATEKIKNYIQQRK